MSSASGDFSMREMKIINLNTNCQKEPHEIDVRPFIIAIYRTYM